MTLAVIVPVLGRARLIQPLLANIDEATLSPHRTIFVCSPNDEEATAACQATGAETIVAPFASGRGDFAKKVNLAYRSCDEPWLFQAATDLSFQRGWDTKALRVADASNAGVVGTNDLGNPMVKRGKHSTHTLFSRAYIQRYGGTFDGTGDVFSEVYHHVFCDTEFIQLAVMRGQFRACRGSVVEHLHPSWRKAESDPVYEKGVLEFQEDAKLYNERIRTITRHYRHPSRHPSRRRG